MQAALNIEGIAHFTIEIEGASMPPTMNMLDSIFIMDGFGIGIPTLKIVFNDSSESLSKDLNIADGTLIKIKIGKSPEKAKEREFRVFGWERKRLSKGPVLETVAILNVPEFSAGSFCEAFSGTSSSVMEEVADACGFDYDGPKDDTDDEMTWINLNTTRLSFSEDTAMRGYAGDSSCMARVITMDKVLRYKDLFAHLNEEEPKFSFVHNESATSADKGTPHQVRESRDASVSGISTHYVNYGQKHFMHSMSGEDDVIESVAAPQLGQGFPVNEDVRKKIEERGSRVTYSGYDYGTGPDDGYNVHEKYEQAYYQNLRFLAMFSERMKIMVDSYTECQTFDIATYRQATGKATAPQSADDVSSKYIVGGKTIYVMQGKKYSETFYLYRPFVSKEAGKGSGAQSAKPAQNAKASRDGEINRTPAGTPAQPAPTNTPTVAANPNAQIAQQPPAVDTAHKSMQSLDNFNNVTPAVPVTPTNAVPDANARSAMDSVRSSTNAIGKMPGPLGNTLREVNTPPRDVSFFQRATTFGSDFMKRVTNGGNIMTIASDIDQYRGNPEAFKANAIGRVSGAAGSMTGLNVRNIVSAATGQKFSVGDIAADVIKGGVWVFDLEQNGINPGSLDLPFEIPFIDTKLGQAGASFMQDMTGFGLTRDNITINPYKTAQAINNFARATDPQQFLLQNGAQAYAQTFGNVSPTDAKTSLIRLSAISAKVMAQYSKDEWLTDAQRTNRALTYTGKETLFAFGGKGITPMVSNVERIVDYGSYQNVETTRKATTWANFYQMGAQTVNSAQHWEPPFFPAKTTANKSKDSQGFASTFGDNFKRWISA